MRIRSVKRITPEEPVPVYDIEVPETSNFKLSAGPVVHNSKDIVDALAIAIKRGAEDNIGQGVLEWLFREKTGKEIGAPKS